MNNETLKERLAYFSSIENMPNAKVYKAALDRIVEFEGKLDTMPPAHIQRINQCKN